MKTKEELLKRVDEILSYFKMRSWHQQQDYNCHDCNAIRKEDIENSDDMANFLIELVNIMKKYNIKGSGVNGHWCNFCTKTNSEDEQPIRFGVANVLYLLKSQEEMDKDLEEGKKVEYERMLNNRIKFVTLPITNTCVNEKYCDNNCCEENEEYEDSCEIDIEDTKKHLDGEFIADIETYVKLNNLETFKDENDIQKEICNKLAEVIDRLLNFDGIKIKNPEELNNSLCIEEYIEGKNAKLYHISINNVVFVYTYYYNEDIKVNETYIVNAINNCIKYMGICKANINVKNIKILSPDWLIEQDTNFEGIDEDILYDNLDDEDDEYDREIEYDEDDESEMYDYDASGSFIADIELNIGKVEYDKNLNDEDLKGECWDKMLDILSDDGVEVDNDDDLYETFKFKTLDDGTTLVKAKGAECSVLVNIKAYNLDNANDDHWDKFYKIINPLKYLKNIREEYVSEAD